MKLGKLVKGAMQRQLLKGVASKSSMDDMVYKEYFKRLNKAIETKKLGAISVRILKGILKQAKKVKEPNKYTLSIVDGMPCLFENRKCLRDSDVSFIVQELIPYLKSCQEVFKDKELDAVMPLLKKVGTE